MTKSELEERFARIDAFIKELFPDISSENPDAITFLLCMSSGSIEGIFLSAAASQESACQFVHRIIEEFNIPPVVILAIIASLKAETSHVCDHSKKIH